MIEENRDVWARYQTVQEVEDRLERKKAFSQLNVQEIIMVKLLRYDEVRLKAGQTPLLGFFAAFVTNIRIPAFVGVGKRVPKWLWLMEYASVV